MILRSVSLSLVFVFVFCLLVFARQMPSGATLRGRFVYEDSGLPLRRTWVGLTKIKSFRDPVSGSNTENAEKYPGSNANTSPDSDGELVLTGDNGEYVLKNVEPGIYFPHVQQVGIYNPDINDAEKPNFRQITVIGGEEINVDFAVKRGGSVQGRIAYQDGSPATGVSVTLIRSNQEPNEDDSVVLTDDRGIYRFSGLNVGDYFVYASEPVVHTDRSAANWAPENQRKSILKVFFPEGYSRNSAAKISVELGQENPNIDIVIPNHLFGELSGTVVSARNGTPISGYAVSFAREDDETRYDQNDKWAVSDESGRWSFHDLLPGKYNVKASRTNRYVYMDDEGSPDASVIKYASVSKDVEIVEGVNGNIVFELPVAASIKGTVEFEEKPGEGVDSYMFISALNENQDTIDTSYVPGYETAAGENTFFLVDLPGGSYQLDVSTPGGPYVRSVTLNGEDLTKTRIKLSEGEAIEGVRIIMASDFGTVDGRITNQIVPEGRAVFLTSVEYSDNSFAADLIKPDGTFKLRAKAGRYYLITREFDAGKVKSGSEDVRAAWEERIRGAEIVELKPREITKVTITID